MEVEEEGRISLNLWSFQAMHAQGTLSEGLCISLRQGIGVLCEWN